MNYLTTDKPCPRGEICIRGPPVSSGYFKEPEKTKEVFKDGWLHSGDIGKINEDGTLSVIDRAKNIFKLSQGEYIAPENLENVYCRNRYVAQIFVFGNSLESQLVAVVVPDQENLTQWAKGEGIIGDFKTICKDARSKIFMLKQLTQTAQQNKLIKYEYVNNLHLEPELWTSENGILTPTMKLKRFETKQKYESILNNLYDELHKQPQTKTL